MAEEVPVSDVLCSAMEYLCKLGSNLRTRSENLRDKKISKDKLRNAHAVRKAASKVLLLCELSRKSLDNVVDGVKRVLTIVDASRCSPVTVGAIKENAAKKQFFYFEYDSCKLRISEKILLKHYTSVKVQARSMLSSMVEKYPVYYNCNLYRRRKESLKDSKESKSPKSAENVKKRDACTDSDNSSNDVQDKTDVFNKEKEKDKSNSDESDNSTKEKKREGKSKSIRLRYPSKSKTNNKIKGSDDEATAVDESDVSCKETKKESKTNEESEKDPKCIEGDNSSENTMKSFESKESSKNDSETNNVSHKEASNKSKSSPKKNDTSPEEKDNDDNEPQKRKEKQNTSSDDSKEKPKTDKADSESKSIHKSSVTNEENEPKTSAKSIKSKTVRFIDSDSDQTSETATGNERKKIKLDKENQKTNEEIVLIEDSPIKPRGTKKQTEAKEDSDSSNSDKKPVIKLVSLNKLLKPDILKKELSKEDNDKITGVRPVTKTYKNLKLNKAHQEKKNEVSAFKPKKFDVVVTRLPKFSDVFLCKYGLTKITRNGSEIYCLTNNSSEDEGSEKSKMDTEQSSFRSKSKEKTSVKVDLSDAAKKSKLDEEIEETNTVLLNSDSGDDTSKKVPNNHKVTRRQSKSKPSDSNDEGAEKSESKHTALSKNNESRDQSSKGPGKNGKVVEECIEKLASNSDLDDIISLESADTPNTPENKTVETEKATPQSRRKLIRETMHAKKMLLTYSSSSDTDDEKLRSTLKEIKTSLLKGSSSEDEMDVKKIVQMNRRRLATPSDSEDSIKLNKRKLGKVDPIEQNDQDSSISQVDENHDELSNSSSSQVRP